MHRPLRALALLALTLGLLLPGRARPQGVASALPAGDGAPAPASPAAPARRAPAALLAPRVSDAELREAFHRWHAAWAAGDTRAADAALQALLAAREDAGAGGLDAAAVALLRAADVRQRTGDLGEGVALAQAAAALAPGLPEARLGLAAAYLRDQPTGLGRALPALRAVLPALLDDPRAARPLAASAGAAGLAALAAACALAVLLVALRHLRPLLHDAHHLLPRGAARWQSALLALAVLLAPAALGWGVWPALAALGLASLVHARPAERGVVLALLALLAGVPWAAGELAERTAFAGTPAEDVYVLERGGPEAGAAAVRVRARVEDGSARFEELFALGRLEARRGELDAALEHLQAATALRPQASRLLVNLGNVRLARGDAEGAAELYRAAAQADPLLPAAPYNLSLVLRRRARAAPDALVGQALARAEEALGAAAALEPALAQRADPPEGDVRLNRLVLSPPLAPAELAPLARDAALAARVRAQVAGLVWGPSDGSGARLGGAALALLGLWAFVGLGRRAARRCDKCGHSVCRRCDPGLPRGASLCSQCVNAFVRRGLVPAQGVMRKEWEVARHRAWSRRVRWALGALVPGAGHLAAGRPVRGVLFALPALALVALLAAPGGWVRAPYAPAAGALGAVLLGLVLFLVWGGALVSLGRLGREGR